MAGKFKKIKILFTIPNFDTAGSGKALLKVAQGLDSEKFEPEILCMHKKGAFFKVVEDSGIPIHVFKYTTQMKPYFKGLVACFKVSKKFREINPDIIHSFHYAPDYSEPLAAKLAGKKWVYTKKNMNWGGGAANGWKLRSLLAKRILVQNTDMLKDFFPMYKNVDLVPRGVDIQEFFPFQPNINIKEKLGLSSNTRIVICVANLVPVKGIEILIQAFHQIKEKNNWTLVIVGDNQNDYGEELKKITKELNLRLHVVFTGKVLNVKEYLNSSEIFVLPTLNKGRREGSPVSLLEAMACGLNVLGSDIPGIRDQLSKFSNHLFQAGSVDELKDKLVTQMNAPSEENKQKGLDFKFHIENNYTIGQEVNNTEKTYLAC